ncbi:MAG: cyclic nucleotide-binding domain-containing protein [Deltaproteobacteria bacterium]
MGNTVFYTIHASNKISADEIEMRLMPLAFLPPNDKERRRLASGVLRSFSAGDNIFAQGEYGTSMFALMRGRVSLQLASGFGAEAAGSEAQKGIDIPLRILDADGDQNWFGERGVLGRGLRPYTACALTDVMVLQIDKIDIDRLDAAYGDVIAQLERLSEQNTIETFLLGHRAFASLTSRDLRPIWSNGRLRQYGRGEVIDQRGGSSDTVRLVKGGVAKLTRAGVGANAHEIVLAYYGSGDIVGTDASRSRMGSLLAMSVTEVVEVPRNAFDQVRAVAEVQRPGWSEQFEKITLDANDAPARVTIGDGASSLFLNQLLADTAQDAKSLMTIDLDLCIRCGNCVRSCEARHGFPKMVRRGNKLDRTPANPSDPKPLLIPTSCRHCESPECMVGCPTGAIHLKPTGEVAIRNDCIGCSNCALRCPWDNITMVAREKVERPELGIVVEEIASKCDLCFGYSEANCVYNCPTQAILRVDPVQFFPEVAAQLPERKHTPQDATKRRTAEARDHSRLVIWSIAAVVFAVLAALWATAAPYSPASARGGVLGGVALLCFAGATALAWRRRRNGLGRLKEEERNRRAANPNAPSSGRVQWGPFYLWARAHVALGTLGLGAALLHADFAARSLLSAGLVLMMLFAIATGLFGVFWARWMPKAITRIEGDAQLEEDLRDELAAGLAEETRVAQLEAGLRLHAVRRVWLVAHICTAVGLLALLAVHVAVGLRILGAML